MIEEGVEQDDYAILNRRIFLSLKELQEEHHSTQSKMLIIRNYVSELEDIFAEFTLSSKV